VLVIIRAPQIHNTTFSSEKEEVEEDNIRKHNFLIRKTTSEKEEVEEDEARSRRRNTNKR
jgi:hypothetical protein